MPFKGEGQQPLFRSRDPREVANCRKRTHSDSQHPAVDLTAGNEPHHGERRPCGQPFLFNSPDA